MKVRLNKATLAAMPEPIRAVVAEWRERYHKTTIGIEHCTSFYIEEDAHFTAFSPDLELTKSVRAGGEWAGATELRPGSRCPLPAGCTMIEEGLFCGVPYLTIFHNPAPFDALASGLLPALLTA